MRITDFESLVELTPQIIKDKLNDCKTMRENPKWHPEESVFEHIRIVTERCIAFDPNDIDLILAGLLHDICKFDCKGINKNTGFPTSYGHDNVAAKFIETNTGVQKFIKQLNSNVDNVALLVKNHMRMHVFREMRESKQNELMMKRLLFPKMVVLSIFDNMLVDDSTSLSIANTYIINDIAKSF